MARTAESDNLPSGFSRVVEGGIRGPGRRRRHLFRMVWFIKDEERRVTGSAVLHPSLLLLARLSLSLSFPPSAPQSLR